MKTLILSLSLLLLGLWCQAQTADELAIQQVTKGETMAAMAGDVARELSYWREAPYTSLTGSMNGKVLFVQGFEPVKRQLQEWNKSAASSNLSKPEITYTDFQLRTNGPSAWATYRQKVTYPDGQAHTTRESRYLEKVGKEWKIVNVTFLLENATYTNSGDETAIKKVIEAETQAFGEGLADKVLAYWAHAPYITHSMEMVGYESLNDAFNKFLTQNPSGAAEYRTAKNSDYNIRVNGNSAWATFTQERQTRNGTIVRATQGRYMEKQDGGWKLVAVLGQDEVPPMTESTVQALAREYEQNPSSYFKKYCTSDYVLVGSEGETYSLEQTLALLKKVGSDKVTTQLTDLHIRNFGKTAIITGINTSTFQLPDNKATTYKDRFTYTYQYDGGMWKWVSAQHAKLDYRIGTSVLTER